MSEDPAAAAELCALLDELWPEQDQDTVRDIHINFSGGVQRGTVNQSGVVSGLTFGAPSDRPSSG
ncbi:hypothetical protein [Streptomyces sp. NPDC017993]|uniref:hypothetical protein n=1 Tax=Streptomyces sp. NPDC017993 TaxID=3365027 RepID=UPI0037B5F63B